MSDIILYDLPSKDRCACWSPNPWKTRLALNYKALPYKTEWTEYPDIAPKLKSLGLAPADDDPPYTIPAVRFPDGTVIMDSSNIADELEKRYPSPSLHIDSSYHTKVMTLLPKALGPLIGDLIPYVPDKLLNAESSGYFHRTRTERFGMPLSQYAKEKGGEGAWEAAAPALKELGQVLREESGGPYFMGSTPSYADFRVVAALQWIKRLGDGRYERIVGYDAAFGKLFDACGKWSERDDY